MVQQRFQPTQSGGTPFVLPGRKLAVPSWVIPGTVLDNALFVSGLVDEVGLLFMEAEASLAYGPGDLPLSLTRLPLSWHVHLPLDLNWDKPGEAADICCELLDKVAHLAPWCGVLHPPHEADALEAFATAARKNGHHPARFVLENIHSNDLINLTESIVELDFGVCLDLGHALAYGQEAILEEKRLLDRCALVHWNAPGKGEAHSGLDALDREAVGLARLLAARVPKKAVMMMELFKWEDVCASFPILRSWLEEGKHGLFS